MRINAKLSVHAHKEAFLAKVILAAFILVATLLQTGCSSSNNNPVTSISLSQQNLNLVVGESKTLIATIYPSDADNPVVTWTSSNSSVASVEQSGKVTAIAAGTSVVACHSTDGNNVYAECKVTVEDVDVHEYIDLGLPSGTLWATCNVGANSPEEYGDYFAWGETEPKSEYNWGTYKWMNEGQSSWKQVNKYTLADNRTDACWYSGGMFVGDGQNEILPEDDAATNKWGNNWQMPSEAQFDELINENYTSSTDLSTLNGVNGRYIISKINGKSLFLPAAGTRYNTGLDKVGSNGYYWSRSLHKNNSSNACYLFFSSNDLYTVSDGRLNGRCVRPVRVKK